MTVAEQSVNFYEVLGVREDASVAEIKQAYRRLSQQAHPDRGGNEWLFRAVEEAHRTLSDANARVAYDEARAKAATQAHGVGGHGPPPQTNFKQEDAPAPQWGQQGWGQEADSDDPPLNSNMPPPSPRSPEPPPGWQPPTHLWQPPGSQDERAHRLRKTQKAAGMNLVSLIVGSQIPRSAAFILFLCTAVWLLIRVYSVRLELDAPLRFAILACVPLLGAMAILLECTRIRMQRRE